MNRTVLPIPPNPQQFTDLGLWALAVYAWMNQVKSRIEGDSAANVGPVGPFVVGAYTATNTIVGTDATSNFVASFVKALQTKGITTPSGGGVLNQ